MNKLVAIALALTAMTSRVADALAGAPDMFGLGSRSIGMGGAVAADVQDFSANYYNPAGLARGQAYQLTAGYGYAQPWFYSNGRNNDVDPARAVFSGLVVPVQLFGIPFSFGLALSIPDQRLASARLLPESQPRWQLYDNDVQQAFFAANIAIEPVRGIRIGGGFGYIASAAGTVGLTGQIPATGDAQLFHTVNADVLAVYYPQVGAQVDLLPNLTVALVYRGEYRFRVDLNADLDVQIVVGRLTDPMALRANVLVLLQEQAIASFLPQQGVVAASWRPIPSVTVAIDLTWVNWSAYVNPAATVQTTLHYDMPPGSQNIVVPMIPPSTPNAPASFRDTLVPRIGIEWRPAIGPHQLAFRLGYRYDPSPVPDQLGATNFLDCTRHVIAAGAGIRLRHTGPTPESTLSLDVHADLQLLEQRTIMKEDPADPVGDAVIGGQALNVGVTLGTTF